MTDLDPATTCTGECTVKGLCKPCFKALGDSPANARRLRKLAAAVYAQTTEDGNPFERLPDVLREMGLYDQAREDYCDD